MAGACAEISLGNGKGAYRGCMGRSVWLRRGHAQAPPVMAMRPCPPEAAGTQGQSRVRPPSGAPVAASRVISGTEAADAVRLLAGRAPILAVLRSQETMLGNRSS